MTDQAPVETTNLDRYGNAALPWSRVHDHLDAQPQPDNPGGDQTTFLGTTRPDGRPHATPVGALWVDGDLFFTSNLATRKSRNLAANPACTISVRLPGIDVVLEGTARRETDPADKAAVTRFSVPSLRHRPDAISRPSAILPEGREHQWYRSRHKSILTI